MRSFLLFLILPLLFFSCRKKESLEAVFQQYLQEGIRYLEEDQPEPAIKAFDSALSIFPTACPPKIGKVLAYLLQFNAQTRTFNRLLFGSRSPDPEKLKPQVGGIVDEVIVKNLLEPSRIIFTNLVSSATSLKKDRCTLKVNLPIKYSIGTILSFYAILGPIWSTREINLLSFLVSSLLALDSLLLSHNLDVPPASAIRLLQRFDTSSIVGALRSFGIVLTDAESFLDFHPDPERKALFFSIPPILTRALDFLLLLGEEVEPYFDLLPPFTGEEVFYIVDRDKNSKISLGDHLVFRIRGKVQIRRDPPITISPVELTIHPYVNKEVFKKAVSSVTKLKSVFEGKEPPGTRFKLFDLNGVFLLFGQPQAFEDVLEIDPRTWFLGPLKVSSWVRKDLNSNCEVEEGTSMVCPCKPSDPATGRVLSDVIVVENGEPREICLREGFYPVDPTYPDPPNPLPLKVVLPYVYKDPNDPSVDPLPVLGVEGEKSANLLPTFSLPFYLTYGDFYHFLFPTPEIVVQGGRKVTNLTLPPDCIEPPKEDNLGLITIPYFAFPDPTFVGGFVVNLSVLTGGECQDSQNPSYRVWNLPDLYSINKVIAHFANRYGNTIYTLFTFLVR